MPSISTWPEIEDIFNAEFQRAFSGEIDPDTAIANVQTRSEDAFRRAASDP